MTTKIKIHIDYTLFGKEAARLLNIEKELFEQVLNLPHVFDGDNQGKGKEYFVNGIQHIENELQKLEKMEVVIAVVGTMKAGKSTTINAIVGTEVLPNRNAPMTTLPTLIRNKHGQVEPILKLNKLKPLENLSKDIAKKLAALVQSNEIGQLDLYNAQDGRELIEGLLKHQGYQFQSEYQGQQAIFSFLKHLNDLMRLAKEALIDLEPPYQEYENLNDLPVIEIEFYHLKGKADSAQGSLAILDTPGPNEFGQSEKLRKVFKTQLEKASAVALVIDYTQMKSESEATVRREVAEVTKQLTKDNLYILVNKFDQTNSNSMQKDEVQDYVVKTLMENTIERGQVYPISAQHAYLANRTKHTLELQGKLPDFQKEGWVADFGKLALGMDWEEDIDDVERCKKRAETLWNKSHFNEPLVGIIQEAHSTAAEKSLKSAVLKLVSWHQELTNTCSIINTSITSDISKINEAIQSLNKGINDVAEVKKNVATVTEERISELSVALNQLADNNQQAIKDEIERFFKEGKSIEKQVTAQQLKEDIKTLSAPNFRDLAAFLLSGGEVDRQKIRVAEAKKKAVFDAENPVISFRDQDDADKLTKDIQRSIIKIFENLAEQFSFHSSQITSKMAEEIFSNINQVTTESLTKAQEKLGDSGFQLNLSLPKMTLSLDSFDPTALLANGLQTKTESKTSQRRTTGVWGSLCSWFGTSDWGWETYTYQQTTYEVDINKIRNSVLKQLEAYKADHTAQFEGYLHHQFIPVIGEHINELVSYLSRYRDLLNNGIKSNQLEQEEKKQLRQQLITLISKSKAQNNDIKVIEGSL